METFRIEMQREKEWNRHAEYSRTVG
jgi:hypothetical protein